MAQNLVLNILAKDKTKVALSGVRAGLSNLKSAIFSVQSALLSIGAGFVVKSFINVGREVEQLRLRFFFLFGSVQEGEKAFKELVSFAAKVPFTLQEIAQASGNLAVVSKDSKELAKNLELVGNIAAVTGIDFRLTAEQVQRSLSSGLASAEIFRERGVRNMLGFKNGVALNAEESAKALEKVFGKGGRFGKAAEVLGTTFDGTLSMIGDKIFKFKLETNEAGFFDFIKGGLITINKLAEENQSKLNEMAKALGLGMIQFIKSSVTGMLRLFEATKSVFLVVIAGIKGVVNIINFLPPVVRELGILGFFMLGARGKAIVFAIGAVLTAIKKILEKLGIEIDLNINGGFDETNDKVLEFNKFLQRAEEELKANTSEVIKIREEVQKANEEAAKLARKISPFRKEIEKLNEDSLKKLTTLSKQAFEIFDMGVKGMSNGIAKSIVLGEDLKTSFKTLAQEILIKIISALIEIAVKIGVQIALENTSLGILLAKLGVEQQITAAKKEQTDEMEKQNKAQGTAMLMSGNPLGFLGFMAKGGAVSKGKPFVVGENGPELFIPNSTGQITQSARGTGGGAVSVNFNINTLDARGFDELLVRNRGTITQIINNAVNERGSKNLI